MDEQATMREVTRRLQDAARKGQERIREASDDATGMAGVATDALGVWLQTNQQVLHNVLELSTNVTQQAVRLLADVQQANLQAMQEMQANRLRWLCSWPEAFRDPAHHYQRLFEEGVRDVTRTCELGQRNGQAVTQSLERMQSAAEQATQGLPETFRDAGKRMQEMFQRAERVRAA